jgi:acyl-CoA thioester hydrolase
MAKPEAWRLDASSYPIHHTVNTRFQDLDPNGHLNNVAFAALFEHGRVRLNLDIRDWRDRPADERTMVVVVTINYLGEGHYPDDVIVCTGIGRIGSSSWEIVQALFQNGRCIATCDSVIAARKGDGPNPHSPEIREALARIEAKPAL